MNSSFKKRVIRITLTLAKGTFGSTGKNTLTVQGLRTSASIQTALSFASAADVTIFGLKQTDMNALTTYGTLTTVGNVSVDDLHTVLVEVGDVSGVDVVFFGHIFNSWADYSGAPNVALRISASAGLYQRIAPAKPHTYDADFKIQPVLEELAKDMGYTSEMSGIENVMLPPSYFCGTAYAQADKICHDANVNLLYDGRLMAVFPKDGQRKVEIPILTKDSGLIGYPIFDNLGLSFQCLYTPRIIFGGAIQLEMDRILADAAKANKELGQDGNNKVITTWFVTQCSYFLESEVPGGQWFMDVRAANVSTVRI